MASEERVWGKMWVQPSQPDGLDDSLIVGSLWSDSDAAGGALYVCTALSPITFQSVGAGGPGVTAHDGLSGLSADDHAQYALLAGRGGAPAVSDAEFGRLSGATGNIQTQLNIKVNTEDILALEALL